jgi:uncharacterized membrane protein YesL
MRTEAARQAIMARMAAFRTLWTALVSLYEDTLVLVVANLATIALNLPVGIVLFLIGVLVLPNGDASNTQWVVVVIGWLLPFLPTPGNVALGGLTRIAAGPDVPRLWQFRESLRRRWRLALRASLVSLLVLGGLVWNVAFYASVGTGWLQLVSILWLYACLFWLSLHIYLVPLMLHVTEPRLFDLYRRATFIALGYLGYTLILLIMMLLVALAAIIFLPVYMLVGVSFISLIQAQALREIRRRHGDLVAEVDEEAGGW